MRGTSRDQRFTVGAMAVLFLAMGLTWVSGPFPIPWNDELVFTAIGHRFLHTGHLTESFWAMYDPRFGLGLVNTPPLYPIFVGLMQAATGGSLLAMRLVHGALLIGGLAFWVRSRLGDMEPGPATESLPWVLFLSSIVANPCFLRAAFFIRPDGFILLAFLWLAGHIWSKTFLVTGKNACRTGVVMGLAGQTHFSALVLIPLFALGLILALCQQGRSILVSFQKATLLGCILMAPYLAWFLPKFPDWWHLIRETQGAQKYSDVQTIGAYLWPPGFLMSLLPTHQGAPAAWGPEATYHLWVVGLAVLPLVAAMIALHKNSAERGLTFWLLGVLGTWFFIRLPEIWFATLGVVSLQVILMSHLLERFGPLKFGLTCGGITLLHLISHGLFLVKSGLPSWAGHQSAINQIETLLEQAIPGGPTHLYVSALPDPSVDLMARWPGLKITRGMDFHSYHGAYSEKVLIEPQAWILGTPMVQPGNNDAPQAFLFDWRQTLFQATRRGELDLHPVRWGDYRIWVALRRPKSPAAGSARPKFSATCNPGETPASLDDTLRNHRRLLPGL